MSLNNKNSCQWNTDWEGVFGFNDMAFELTRDFHPEGKTAGEEFFAKISKVDDWWAITRPGYHAGTTLVLILPFFKVWEVTDAKMKKYAADHLRLMPGTKETLEHLSGIMPVFVISTTYSNCMIPVAELTGIPRENLYCTQVNLDSYQFNSKEIRQIDRLTKEIGDMPILDWHSKASRDEDLNWKMQSVAKRLHEIFFSESELMGMEAYRRMIKEIKVVGGPGKAEAIEDSCQKTGNSLSKVVYTGDSITDVQALTKVRENGGLAISVNGNRYAVRAAEIACMLDHTAVLDIILSIFVTSNKEALMNFVRDWRIRPALDKLALREALIERMRKAYPDKDKQPAIQIVAETNLEQLIEKSEAHRKHVRGEVIGKLG